MKHRILFLILFLLLFVLVAFAQDATPEQTPEATAEVTATANPEATAELTPEVTDAFDQCPVVVETALQVTELSCTGTGTNQACYGFVFIDAALRNNEAQFTTPGDILDVINIQALQLSPMDTETGQWGVMVMSVEANLTENPVTPTDEDVQVILFGDTQISDASQFIQVQALSDVNVRVHPRATAEILGSLAEGDTIVANSRLEDGSWIRVRFEGDEGATIGWISAEFLAVLGDIEALPVLTAEEAELPPSDLSAQYGPMQAFIFESGENDAPCSQAPNSGMLIQTPEGAASVTLWMDEVVIQLNGTGVISAQADGTMSVGIIDGVAQVEANGESRTVVAGQATDIELDSNLAPISAPSAPRPLDSSETQALPVGLLENPVTVPTPLNNPSNVPIAGQWTFSLNTPAPYICSDGSEVYLQSTGIPASITPQLDALDVSGLSFPQVTEGVYGASYVDDGGNLIQDTLQVVSTDRIIGERTIDFANPICTLNLSFTLQLIQPN